MTDGTLGLEARGRKLRLQVLALLALLALLSWGVPPAGAQERPRLRDLGVVIGKLPPGPLNALTDVPGVRVGHATLSEGDSLRSGVTAVLPHGGNLFREKVPGAIVVGNGFGKLVGSTQVNELGEIETPVLLTGTLSVWRAADALVDTLLAMPANREVRSINPVVGETNDGWLSDIRARPIGPEHVRRALRSARDGPVEEGSVGAGTGTRALGWKGGIGTSSRVLPEGAGGHTVGVLVQSNYGGLLRVDGLPVWRRLGRSDGARRPPPSLRDGGLSSEVAEAGPEGTAGRGPEGAAGGSVMVVVATDAPVTHHELRRMARRAFLGIGKTGFWRYNGSGDYAIAFSVDRDGAGVREGDVLSLLFRAVIEATEEAALNSIVRATTVTGRRGRTSHALPVERLRQALEEFGLFAGDSGGS